MTRTSFGFGLNYQQFDAEFTRAVVTGLNTETVAGRSRVKDISWGFNVGCHVSPTPDTSLGVSYRSSIKYNLTGNVYSRRGFPTLKTATRPSISSAGHIFPGVKIIARLKVDAARGCDRERAGQDPGIEDRH